MLRVPPFPKLNYPLLGAVGAKNVISLKSMKLIDKFVIPFAQDMPL